MKYSELQKNSNVQLTNIIYKAMSIYSELQDMDLYRPTNEEAYINVKIDKRDTSVLSLFLAVLASDIKVTKILKQYGISYEKMIETLKIEELKMDKLSNQQYNRIYNKAYKDLLEKLIYLGKNMDDCDDLSTYSPTLLYQNLVDEAACDSEIVMDLLAASGIDEKNVVKANVKVENMGYGDDDLDDEAEERKATVSTSSKSKSSNIKDFGDYLTDQEYVIDPAIGRDKELNALMVALATPYMSAILLGESGVGKTAIAEGLAYRIKKGTVPDYFKDWKIFSANVTNVVSGTSYRGEFEAKVNKLINTIKSDGKTILFIDEFHTVIGAGEVDRGKSDLANMLKPYLSRGTLKVIGATTNKEYDEFVSNDPALKRRLERVNVKEQNEEDIEKILKGTIPLYEHINKVKFAFTDIEVAAIIDVILETTAKRHRQYFDMQYNPGLALSILGKSFAIATVRGSAVVEKEDIALAIKLCERLYEDVRESKSREVNNMIFEHREVVDNNKIIDMSQYIKKR